MSPSSRGRGLKHQAGQRLSSPKKSPSSRGRGLKRPLHLDNVRAYQSPSSRGRGLKLADAHRGRRPQGVALFTRAWIETSAADRPARRTSVALFTRAWIETQSRPASGDRDDRSPSSRGRGLKPVVVLANLAAQPVALFTRAWIETICGWSCEAG